LLVFLNGTDAKPKKHRFIDGEIIPFYVNNIGPYANPTETYEYYSLPFCAPEVKSRKHQKIGEMIEGDRAITSLYKLPFRTNFTDAKLCDPVSLKKDQVKQFINAISKLYYFEMIYDDLPLYGFIGLVDRDSSENPKYYLFKHLDFHIEYNRNQIIRINVTSDYLHELKEDDPTPFIFTYSATWYPTNWPFEKRMELYVQDFFNQDLEIHWLSIMNSFVLVVLLTGFLAIIIMRVLKSDYARYARTEDEEDDQEDYGWKLIHGDVFRFPNHKNVFSAFMGIGMQFLSIVIGILLLALLGLFYPNNGGNLYVAAISLYAVTAGIGGFVSGRMYKQMNGERWAWSIILTATIFVVPFVLVVSYVNSVAIYYHVTAALPALTIIEVITIWMFVGFPLTVLGGIAGKRLAEPFEAPCRTKNFPREIPPIPWYRRLPFQMLMAGFLPFSAIYIELFYIYSSVWGHTSYTLYGILCLVFIILIIVTACITVALTYFQLSMEDHRWWWTSFINGGSTGIFIYVYSIFYYVYRSKMTGVLQGSFYFAYMWIVCYFFFIMLGSVGFYSSLIFVRRIYKNLKSD